MRNLSRSLQELVLAHAPPLTIEEVAARGPTVRSDKQSAMSSFLGPSGSALGGSRLTRASGVAVAVWAFTGVAALGLLSFYMGQRSTGTPPVTSVSELRGWTTVSAAPVAWSAFPSIVAGENSVIVWGGARPDSSYSNHGVVLNPLNGSWGPTGESPLSGRGQHSAVWTGSEMIVCCGRGEDVRPGAAAYDPTANVWRQLASPPSSPSFALTAWTGDEMLVVGGSTFGGVRQSQQALAYDPAEDSWRLLADLPYAVGNEASSLWTGDHLIVWPSPEFGEQRRAPLAYSLNGDTWEALPMPPSGSAPVSPSLVWTGAEVIVWGFAPGSGASSGFRFILGTEVWEPIPAAPLPQTPPFEGTAGSQAAVWTGEAMIVWTGWIGATEEDQGTRVLAFSPASNSWRELALAPVGPVGLYRVPVVWAAGQLVVYTPEAILILAQ